MNTCARASGCRQLEYGASRPSGDYMSGSAATPAWPMRVFEATSGEILTNTPDRAVTPLQDR